MDKFQAFNIKELLQFERLIKDRQIRLGSLSGGYYNEEIEDNKELIKKVEIEINLLQLKDLMVRR